MTLREPDIGCGADGVYGRRRREMSRIVCIVEAMVQEDLVGVTEAE